MSTYVAKKKEKKNNIYAKITGIKYRVNLLPSTPIIEKI
jgi:hypothetical protein